MTEAEALAKAISGLDATIYAYGVAGAKVAPGLRDRALAGLRNARTSRDRLASALAASGGTVPGAAAAYEIDPPVTDEASAAAAIGVVETRMAGVYGDLAAATPAGAVREAAIAAAMECAVRAAAWGAAPVAFPGR